MCKDKIIFAYWCDVLLRINSIPFAEDSIIYQVLITIIIFLYYNFRGHQAQRRDAGGVQERTGEGPEEVVHRGEGQGRRQEAPLPPPPVESI